MVFPWVISFGALVTLALVRRALAKSFTRSQAVYVPRPKDAGQLAGPHAPNRAYSRGCAWSNFGDRR